MVRQNSRSTLVAGSLQDGIRSQLADLKLATRSLAKLNQLDARGQLFLGWPLCEDATFLGHRLTYWPDGLPTLRFTAIVSSRLGRGLDRKDDVFRVLRLACHQLDPRKQMLLCAEGTTMSRFVSRAGQLLGTGVCAVDVADVSTRVDRWLDSLPTAEIGIDGRWRCHVSPPLNPTNEAIPLRDQIEVLLADQVLALHARKGGTLQQLLVQRLSSKRSRAFLALGSAQLVDQPVARQLMTAGAIGWIPMATAAPTERPLPAPFEGFAEGTPAPIIAAPASDDWPFLTHCTRRTHGHWPDQAQQEFMDELILGEASRDRSSLAALMRIVGQRKLIATASAIRGQTKVVSFSMAHREELLTLHTFRSHRGRWDFEHYGICIHRDVMDTLGGRPVVYGDQDQWDSLSAEERPYFQITATRSEGIDWRVEKEWRIAGDVDLTQVPSDKALVFVPSRSEAEHVARISPWPVAIWTEPSAGA